MSNKIFAKISAKISGEKSNKNDEQYIGFKEPADEVALGDALCRVTGERK